MYFRGIRTREKTQFFDWLIRRTSDETLFGGSSPNSRSMSLSGMSLAHGDQSDRCEQCAREANMGLKGLDHIACQFQTSLHSILWDQGIPALPNASGFLHHTLKMGCLWGDSFPSLSSSPPSSSQGSSYSDRIRIPKEFLLSYDLEERTLLTFEDMSLQDN